MSHAEHNAAILTMLGVSLDPKCEPACDDEYCGGCAASECKHQDPLHRHHDGCPSCSQGAAE